MNINIVYISVKPENLEEFVEASFKNHIGTRTTEAGNLRFDILQKADDPTKFVLYEVFESEEAIRLHKETDHYKVWRDTVNPMMAEKRYGIGYIPLAPKERSEW
ncbi:MAG: antibiotic biosynthesis monooxygenase [Bacteroidia bacterium]|nr:antibiotic biosynthesis monooxygenase [Bacteroidia bacterium]